MGGRGRGRGRGRGKAKRHPIIAFGSSVGARLQIGINKEQVTTPVNQIEQSELRKEGISSTSITAKKLDLSPSPSTTPALLMETNETIIEVNPTITIPTEATIGPTIANSKGTEPLNEAMDDVGAKKPTAWVSLFQKNRYAEKVWP